MYKHYFLTSYLEPLINLCFFLSLGKPIGACIVTLALKLSGFVLSGLLLTSLDHRYPFEKKGASFDCLSFLLALNYMIYISSEIAPEKSTQKQNNIENC